MKNVLIIFARVPKLGQVKTRLADKIGKKKALKVYKYLLNRTINIKVLSNIEVKTYWTDKETDSNYYQIGNDLGERMYNALTDESKKGNKVCLVGTDTPELTSLIIEQAYQELDTQDVVFGPSIDGGYYLVGFKNKPLSALFLNKVWSHKKVLNDALATCDSLNLKVGLLPPLLDIDTIEDYNKWNNTT